jgi:hypothetical protein
VRAAHSPSTLHEETLDEDSVLGSLCELLLLRGIPHPVSAQHPTAQQGRCVHGSSREAEWNGMARHPSCQTARKGRARG